MTRKLLPGQGHKWRSHDKCSFCLNDNGRMIGGPEQNLGTEERQVRWTPVICEGCAEYAATHFFKARLGREK